MRGRVGGMRSRSSMTGRPSLGARRRRRRRSRSRRRSAGRRTRPGPASRRGPAGVRHGAAAERAVDDQAEVLGLEAGLGRLEAEAEAADGAERLAGAAATERSSWDWVMIRAPRGEAARAPRPARARAGRAAACGGSVRVIGRAIGNGRRSGPGQEPVLLEPGDLGREGLASAARRGRGPAPAAGRGRRASGHRASGSTVLARTIRGGPRAARSISSE